MIRAFAYGNNIIMAIGTLPQYLSMIHGVDLPGTALRMAGFTGITAVDMVW
jgi:hypothetical protein